MGYFDDDYEDDDVYYTDDPDVNDVYDDDEEVDSPRSASSNPFSRERSSFSSPSSGTSSTGSSLPGRSNFGGSSFGGRPSSRSDNNPSSSSRDPKDGESDRRKLFGGGGPSSSDSSSRTPGRTFGSGGNSGSSSSTPGRTFGGSTSGSSTPGRTFGGGSSSGSSSSGSSSSGSGRTFGSGGSSGSGSSTPGRTFGGGSPSGSSSSGSSSSGSGFKFGQKEDAPKSSASDNKPRSSSGFSFGRKPADDKKPAEKKDASSGGSSRFSLGRKPPDDKKPAAKTDKKDDDSGGIASRLSGVLPFGRNKSDDDKKPAEKKDAGSGGVSSRLGRFGGGKKPVDDKPAATTAVGGKASPFGRNKPEKSKTTADKAEGGGLFSAIKLPSFGGGDASKKQKTSKTRASKVPKAADGGFNLDLDAKLDIIGVALVFSALILFFSALSGDQGAITGGINDFFVELFGWGSIIVPLALAAVGWWLIARHFGDEPPEVDPVRITGLVVLFLGTLMIMMFIETFSDLYQYVTTREVLILFLEESIKAGRGGGRIGAELYTLMINNVGEFGAVFAMIGWLVIGIMLTTRTSAAELAVFMISIGRSFQVAMQHRAQKVRAERMAQLEARNAAQPAQISVDRPEALPLEAGGATAALPPPDEIPIEERPIPIRMGGQMITANSGQQQPVPVTAGQSSANNGVSVSGSTDESSGGLLGGFAARIRKATPFVSSGDDKPAQPAATVQEKESNGSGVVGAAAAAVGTVATLGGLLGGRGNDDNDSKSSEPRKTPPPVPGLPAQQPAPAAQPGQTAASSPFAGVNENRFQPPAATPSPAASHAAPTREDALASGSAADPTGNSNNGTSVPNRPGTISQGSGTANNWQDRLQQRGQQLNQETGATASDTADSPAADNDKVGRMSRLDQLRSGQAGETARAARQDASLRADLDDENDEEDDEAAASTPEAATRSLFSSLGGVTASKAGDKPASNGDAAPRQDAAAQTPTAAPKTSAPPPPATQTPKSPIPSQQPAATHNGEAGRSQPVINRPQPATPQPQPAASRNTQQWRLPDTRTLLASGSDQEFDREALVRKARTIEETLQSFGAPGRVVEINTGPVITQFGVEPDYLTARGGKKSRVKVSAIATLDKDLQLSLGAKSIRVEAPVPGKGYVGVEVPNDEAALVSLRDVMESNDFTRIKSPLAIGLGQSVDGSPISADLTSMPHLLIAGTTGSGKSVCVNAVIASLLVRNTPDMVKFIMVDPKRVELTGYNGIPHLVAPVVVELERIVGVLKWVTREMDERYKKFSNAGARNIVDFNSNLPAGESRMPYIVVIIDELADLMMLAPDETERVITRIAALARATGIHLVIATQRPSVDVVTGLIKANFPARIAFAVAGGVDSRVILDQPGAERLLGKGDMLYMSGNSPSPQRLQGVYVSDMEINNIVRFWRAQGSNIPQKPITSLVMEDKPAESRSVIPRGERFMQPPPASTTTSPQRAFWEETSPSNPDNHSAGYGSTSRDNDDHEDELYGEAVELVRRLSKASVSLLQRRLRIGYTRAARMIDKMEADGIVGPPTEGSKPREVLPQKK